MTCREFVSFIDRYVSGELSAVERMTFDRHLARCTRCLHYLHGYLVTREIAREVLCDDDALPADVPEELVSAILASRWA